MNQLERHSELQFAGSVCCERFNVRALKKTPETGVFFKITLTYLGAGDQMLIELFVMMLTTRMATERRNRIQA